MLGECIEEASKIRELSPKDISRIADLTSIGIFRANELWLGDIQREIYQISKGKIKKCFFGDSCLFVIFETGYLREPRSYLLKSFNRKDYKDRGVLRHSFLTLS